MAVRLDVHCSRGELIDTFYDSICVKYPFECPECGDTRMLKWPWTIAATTEED